MFTATFSPRFYETDAFGHVNNTVVTGWFETAREPIFPRRVKGNFRNLKWVIMAVTLGIYYLVPWIR